MPNCGRTSLAFEQNVPIFVEEGARISIFVAVRGVSLSVCVSLVVGHGTKVRADYNCKVERYTEEQETLMFHEV